MEICLFQVSGAISTLSENVDKLLQIEPTLMNNESRKFVGRNIETLLNYNFKHF